MEESNKKTNFFKDVLKSIKDLDKYEDFALELPGKAFKYFFKLMLIFSLVISIFYTYKITCNVQEVYTNLQGKLPDFSYSEGNLTMNSEEPIIIDDYKDMMGTIIIDTNNTEANLDNYKDNIKNGELTLLLLKDKCVVSSNETTGQVTYNYSDIANEYNVTTFTKQDAVNYVNSINIVSLYASIYLVIFVYLFMAYFISTLLDTLILSLLAYIVSRITRIQLKYAPSFSIAVHAITLPILLKLIYIIVNLLTGFTIKYFDLMYTTISYIYVFVAILMIKTDFINRQKELIKIEAEQKKIREETETKEENNDNKEKKETNDENENKKPKDEKKDKKDKGEDTGNCPDPTVISEKE